MFALGVLQLCGAGRCIVGVELQATKLSSRDAPVNLVNWNAGYIAGPQPAATLFLLNVTLCFLPFKRV